MGEGLVYAGSVRRPGEIWMLDGHRIAGVHFHEDCLKQGFRCVFHNQSRHYMSDLPLLYRDDRNIFERICEHGIGHPDPDQFEYWEASGNIGADVHGCDGCCASPNVPNSDGEVPCGEPECDLFVFSAEDTYCDNHIRDEWGVTNEECDCSTGPIMVCSAHMTLWSNAVKSRRDHPSNDRRRTT